MADQDRADDSATKRAHGTHGKGDAREELESPAHPEPDESEGQGRGTAACLKHLVANESETLRNFMDSRVSESALRELYLLPFEMAVEDAHAWSMMAAYNDVNGVPATEHDHVGRS